MMGYECYKNVNIPLVGELPGFYSFFITRTDGIYDYMEAQIGEMPQHRMVDLIVSYDHVENKNETLQNLKTDFLFGVNNTEERDMFANMIYEGLQLFTKYNLQYIKCSGTGYVTHVGFNKGERGCSAIKDLFDTEAEINEQVVVDDDGDGDVNEGQSDERGYDFEFEIRDHALLPAVAKMQALEMCNKSTDVLVKRPIVQHIDDIDLSKTCDAILEQIPRLGRKKPRCPNQLRLVLCDTTRIPRSLRNAILHRSEKLDALIVRDWRRSENQLSSVAYIYVDSDEILRNPGPCWHDYTLFDPVYPIVIPHIKRLMHDPEIKLVVLFLDTVSGGTHADMQSNILQDQLSRLYSMSTQSGGLRKPIVFHSNDSSMSQRAHFMGFYTAPTREDALKLVTRITDLYNQVSGSASNKNDEFKIQDQSTVQKLLGDLQLDDQ